MEGDVYDYYLDFKTKRMKPWKDLITTFIYSSNIKIFNFLVHTSETIKIGSMIQ